MRVHGGACLHERIDCAQLGADYETLQEKGTGTIFSGGNVGRLVRFINRQQGQTQP